MNKTKNYTHEKGDMSKDMSPLVNKNLNISIYKKMQIFFRNHKIFAGILLTLLIIITIRIITLPFIAISFPNGELFSIGSVALDRWQMNRINRMEFETSATITITKDQEMIRDFVNATMVARVAGFTTAFRSDAGATIRLYKDDVLVREMDLCPFRYAVRVYHQSPTHWFFLTFGFVSSCKCCGGGLVLLPRDLVERLYEMQIWG